MYVNENTAEFEISGVKANELYQCGNVCIMEMVKI
jgi:hypothetical protein